MVKFSAHAKIVVFWIISIIATLGAALILSPALQDRLIERQARRVLAEGDGDLFAGDALKVVLCGTAAPIPSRDRARSCNLVIAGSHAFVVDTGPGSWNVLATRRVSASRIQAIFLTHFHSDHIGDLGEFRLNSWVDGRATALPVYGPNGVSGVVDGVNAAYALDDQYRMAHHGKLLDPAGRLLKAVDFGLADAPTRPEHAASSIVYEADGLKVTAFQVNHEPVFPAVGYRFDYKGRSLVISGDTALEPNLARQAAGADLLICEAQDNPMRELVGKAAEEAKRPRIARIMHDIASYHMSTLDAARLANEARIRQLVLTHLSPPPDTWITRRKFVRGINAIRPSKSWRLGEDGMVIELPADSTDVHFSTL